MTMMPRELSSPARAGPAVSHPVTAIARAAWMNWPVLAAAAVAAVVVIFGFTSPTPVGPSKFASSNGRIEAERVDIAAKLAGRLKEVLVKEGDTVTAGQVLARMDLAEIEAQLREAEAAVRQAVQQLEQAEALVEQRRSELALADQEQARSQALVGKGYTTREKLDQRNATRATANAILRSANAQVALSRASIDAAVARVESLKVTLADGVLAAPRAGRIQYRLAQPGEVLAAGGRVLTLLDLTDVYMTVFLPTRDAGRLAIGAEARVVFDAAPEYVVPAKVSFVAADAQFTPKYVETKTEREKLMFRVKVQIEREVLERYATLVKTGLPGIAHVKLASDAAWPGNLAVRLPK